MIEFYKYIFTYNQVIYFAVCREQKIVVEYSRMFNSVYSPGVPNTWNGTYGLFGERCERLVEELECEINKGKAHKVSALELLVVVGRSYEDIKKDFKRYKWPSPTL